MASSKKFLETGHASPWPLKADLRISSPTCSLSGKIPFVTTTVYINLAPRPIWVLIRLFSDFADGIVVRYPSDPRRKNRRIGCVPTMNQDEWDEDELDREDTVLVRLNPGHPFETNYTFAVQPKIGGFRQSDVHAMKEGQEYIVELGTRRCRWIFEDMMDEGMSEEERRDVLKKCQVVEWKPDCTIRFTASE